MTALWGIVKVSGGKEVRLWEEGTDATLLEKLRVAEKRIAHLEGVNEWMSKGADRQHRLKIPIPTDSDCSEANLYALYAEYHRLNALVSEVRFHIIRMEEKAKEKGDGD